MRNRLNENDKPTKFYWAYGANLSERVMARRCPGAIKVGALYVHHGRLVFRGVADVIGSRKRSRKVAGGLWLINSAHEASLDRFEGVERRFYTKQYFEIEVEGVVHDCMFYKMNQRGIMPPAESYLADIEQGYRDFGLDLAYLDEALQHSWERKRRTPSLNARHRRKGYPKLARPSLRKAKPYALVVPGNQSVH